MWQEMHQLRRYLWKCCMQRENKYNQNQLIVEVCPLLVKLVFKKKKMVDPNWFLFFFSVKSNLLQLSYSTYVTIMSQRNNLYI